MNAQRKWHIKRRLLYTLNQLPFPRTLIMNSNVTKGTVPSGPAVENAHRMFAGIRNCRGRGKWHTALTLQITQLPTLSSSTQTYLL